MDYEHAVIGLTEHPEVLKRLKRLGFLKFDATKKKDYYTAQFNGSIINFYAGEPRTFPAEIGRALEATNLTYLDDVCTHCKGNGSTVAGLCINCKGKKFLKSDAQYRTLKVIRTYDAMLVDPATLAPAPVEAQPIDA